MKNFKRYLWLSQINLFFWLLLSSALVSSVVFRNGGFSNYGNHYITVIPFTIAFIANVAYVYLAAEALLLVDRQLKYYARYLNVLCIMVLMVYLTTFPRRFGVIFSDIHDNISMALFGYQLLLVIWLMVLRPKLDTLAYSLIMIVGTVIGFLSAIHTIHLMFVGQMVGELGFALLLVLVFPKVIHDELKKRSDVK